MGELSPGVVTVLSDRVRRIVAPNPGIMTGPGTNTYLVGADVVVVIDPGPDDPAHLDAVAGCGGDRIRWVAVTHAHADHAPGAIPLARRVGAEVVAYGRRSAFSPDAEIGDGDVLGSGDARLRALHTPGHASDHLCYLMEDERLLFSGDHVMSGSTVVIAPPDGDMAAYISSLDRLRTLALDAIAPGHGRLINDPAATLDGYIAHRLARQEAVADALGDLGTATVDQLVPVVYSGVDVGLHPIARFSLWAHLRKLAGDGRAIAADPDDLEAIWSPLAGSRR